MTKLIENWSRAHRLSHAVFIAFAAGGLLLWALWNRPSPIVSRDVQVGQVISVDKGGLTEIALVDGKKVRILSLQPAPKSGDKIPMIIETYEDGTVYVMVDQEAWRMTAN